MDIADAEAVPPIKKAKYPWYVVFILGNEFCERFTFYGMKTVLTLYFSNVLLFSEDATTFYYHFFSMLCYFFPIFGAWIADSLIGKFKTIVYLTVVYIVGLTALTLSAIPPLHFHAIAGTLGGLFLIALGTGGIKPCIATYGADQFKPGQETQREAFFSYFYLFINAGSLISTFVIPLVRSNVQCFGLTTCYALAFGIPTILMIGALVTFLLGKRFYEDIPPTGSLITKITCCISHAVTSNIRRKREAGIAMESSLSISEKPACNPAGMRDNNWFRQIQMCLRPTRKENSDHWLDSAKNKYEASFVNDVKQLLQALTMFLLIPMCWALFDQTGSRWTLQAVKMDGRLTENYYWQPDQMLIFVPVLMLFYIPCLEIGVYPLLAKFHIPFRLLSRMVVGMVLAGVAFVIAGFLEIALDKTLPAEISPGMAELRIFNADHLCSLSLTGQFHPSNRIDLTLSPYEVRLLEELPVRGQHVASFTARSALCPVIIPPSNINVNLTEKTVTSIVLTSNKGQLRYRQFEQSKEKPGAGKARVRFIVPASVNPGSQGISLVNTDLADGAEGHKRVINIKTEISSSGGGPEVIPDVTAEVMHGRYNIHLTSGPKGFNSSGETGSSGERLHLLNGGVYTVIFKRDLDGHEMWKQYDIVPPNTINIFWQLPQYFVLVLGEVLVAVSGLSFSYGEAPESMKSVTQAAFLLTNAFGSVIVMIFSGAHLVRSQAMEFFIFAGMIGACSILFAWMSSRYRYRKPDQSKMKKDDQRSQLPPSVTKSITQDLSECESVM